MRLLFLGLALVFVASIGYSRLFLGVHSLNQVLYGLSMGVWFAHDAHHFVKEPLAKLVSSIIDGTETRLLELGLIATGIVLLATIIQTINYYVALKFENPAEWSTMITEKCGEEYLKGAY